MFFEKDIDKIKLMRYPWTVAKGFWGGARKGAGRKKGEIEYMTVSIAIPKDEAEILKRMAKGQGMTVSRFVSKCLGLNAAAEAERKAQASLPDNLTGGKRLC